MLPSLVICLAVAGRLGPDPPVSPDHGFGWFLPPDIEAFNRDYLEWTRNRRAGLEEMIETFEKQLRESPEFFTPKAAARLRQTTETLREHLEFTERIQRELEAYEQQRKLDPGLGPHQAHLERSGKILREWNARQKARERGVIAPPPREKE
jgi:hypothetical protein